MKSMLANSKFCLRVFAKLSYDTHVALHAIFEALRSLYLFPIKLVMFSEYLIAVIFAMMM